MLVWQNYLDLSKTREMIDYVERCSNKMTDSKQLENRLNYSGIRKLLPSDMSIESTLKIPNNSIAKTIFLALVFDFEVYECVTELKNSFTCGNDNFS